MLNRGFKVLILIWSRIVGLLSIFLLPITLLVYIVFGWSPHTYLNKLERKYDF
jgi:hypothetical protein